MSLNLDISLGKFLKHSLTYIIHLGLCMLELGQIPFFTPSKLFSIVCHRDGCRVDDRKLCLRIHCIPQADVGKPGRRPGLPTWAYIGFTVLAADFTCFAKVLPGFATGFKNHSIVGPGAVSGMSLYVSSIEVIWMLQTVGRGEADQVHNHSLGRFSVSGEPVLGKSLPSYLKKHDRTHVVEQPVPLYIFATSVVAALAQGFLTTCVEAHPLTRSRTKNKFITFTLFFLILVATGGAFTCAVTPALFPAYKDRRRVIIPATIWFITEAVTDVSIALALLLKFRNVKSSFKETRSLPNRLVAQTIQTGAAGSTVAPAILIAFLVKNESNGEFLSHPLSIPGSHVPVPTGIAYCLGHVYCLTMVRTLPKKNLCVGGGSQNFKLANLNSRNTGNTGTSKGTSSGANPGTRGERGNQEWGNGGDDHGGIHPSLILPRKVRIDTPQEFSMGPCKTNPGQSRPDDSPPGEVEMTVDDSASYLSKTKQDLFAT
ncbi:hypothetical protein C8J57DRAFT_1258524 [Mycena rebaudengoi]|nr:hypothetical protein C8J57DRAFT_1258524 [Mycena rebaudengoi]